MAKITLNKIRFHLNTFEKIVSIIIHKPIMSLVLVSLEKSFFRTIPMYFGFVAAITAGILMLATAYFFGYQIISLTVLGYIFVLGFVMGFMYEYVRSMVRQIK